MNQRGTGAEPWLEEREGEQQQEQPSAGSRSLVIYLSLPQQRWLYNDVLKTNVAVSLWADLKTVFKLH